MNIASHLRHYLTFLGALGTIFLSWNLLTPDQVAAANDAGSKLIEPLVILIGLVGVTVFRLAIAWLGKVLRLSTGEESKPNDNGPGMMPLLVAACVAGALMTLPSCTPFPVRICFSGDEVEVTANAEAQRPQRGAEFFRGE